jgi:hypothetical protein
MEGQTSPVFSTISSTEEYSNYFRIDSFMGERGLEAVEAADAAYNNGQGCGQQ